MKHIKKIIALPLLLSSSVAFAALDAGVTTALDEAKTDVGTIGGAVLLIIVAIAAFKYIRKAA